MRQAILLKTKQFVNCIFTFQGQFAMCLFFISKIPTFTKNSMNKSNISFIQNEAKKFLLK